MTYTTDTKDKASPMKKMILELFFLEKPNFLISSETPRFVYRHCASLRPFQIQKLAKKLKISLSKLFITTFICLLSDYLDLKEFIVINRDNQKKVSVWSYSYSKSLFSVVLRNIKKISWSSKKIIDMEKLALKMEVKIIKSKILFAFYYWEDFESDKINFKEIGSDYEKKLREIIKEVLGTEH